MGSENIVREPSPFAAESGEMNEALPPFVVHGEWVDPKPTWPGAHRSHPYAVNAWCELIDRHVVVFPNREAVEPNREAARIAVAEARKRRNGGSISSKSGGR